MDSQIATKEVRHSTIKSLIELLLRKAKQSLFLHSQSSFSDLLQHALAANHTAYETDRVAAMTCFAQLFAMQGSCADVVGNVFEPFMHARIRAGERVSILWADTDMLLMMTVILMAAH